MKKIKVAYIHGRPGPHPMHRKFAECVGGEFNFVDFKMRWQDKNKSVLYRLISWLVCALTFPNKKQYNIFLIDNPHFMPVIMKMLGLIDKKQKIVVHLGSHTLYFIYAHRFSKLSEWMHVQALKRYDALICEGKMAEELVNKILKRNHSKTYVTSNGIPDEHFPLRKNHTVNLKGKNILFMGHGPGKNRLWYKGLDLMISAFHLAYQKDSGLTFTIVGNWDEDVIKELVSTCDSKTQSAIHFTGATEDLGKFTREASLYLHCSRGEAFGITIYVAMASGIPAIVSEWTGAKEVVEQIDKALMTPLDTDLISKKILWYFNLPISEKEKLSIRCKEIAKGYTEEKAVSNYKTVFKQIERDLGFVK